MKNLLGVATAFGMAAMASVPAQASTLVDLNNQSAVVGSGYGNAFRYTFMVDGEEVNLQVTGWSINTSANKVQRAEVAEYAGGLGVINNYGTDSSSPQHTVDNQNGYDFLVFQFDRAVDIDSFSIGWAYSDTDATIRYGDLGTEWNTLPHASPLLNTSVGNFTTLFPNTVNVLGDDDIGTRDIPVDDTANTWVISALNPVESYTTCQQGRNGKKNCTTTNGYDYFKVNGIWVSAPTAVPEPASWMMMIGGIGFAGASLRQRRKASPASA